MQKSTLLAIVLISFFAGILTAGPTKAVSQIFRGETSKKCISNTICVGADLKTIYGFRTLDSIGGLSSIFCGTSYDSGNTEYLFLRDILAGSTCNRNKFTLLFQNEFTRTSITIHDGKIAELTQGPLHNLDL